MDDMDDQDRIDGFLEKQRLKNKDGILEVGGFRPEVNVQTVPELIGDKKKIFERIAAKRSQASKAWKQSREIPRE